ncbi:Uncharacterised protein [Chlamydia trachomatis]|nr:Uncharacterised protein [Chlamydia trachomatis]
MQSAPKVTPIAIVAVYALGSLCVRASTKAESAPIIATDTIAGADGFSCSVTIVAAPNKAEVHTIPVRLYGVSVASMKYRRWTRQP